MKIISKRVDFAPGGVRLETSIGSTAITSIVSIDMSLISAPGVNMDDNATLHMTIVENARKAKKRTGEVLANVKAGDVAVFLCSNKDAYQAALDVLGFNHHSTVFDLN